MKTCDSCELQFLSNEGLKDHTGTAHSRKEETEHSGECCDECNVYFNDTGDLRDHIRNQHEAQVNHEESEEVSLDENPEEVMMNYQNNSISSMLNSLLDNIFLPKKDDQKKDECENEDEEKEKDKNEGNITDKCVQDSANEADEMNTATSAEDEDIERDLIDDGKQSDTENNVGESESSDSNDEEEEEDEEICHIQEEMQRIKSENDMLKLKVNELQEERLTQDIRTIKLEEEKRALEETITKGFNQYDALLKEFEKTKKNKKKEEKELENKIAAINNELVKSYSKVDQIYKENVKLLEEKKVLQGIHKVNTEIHEKLKEAENKLK